MNAIRFSLGVFFLGAFTTNAWAWGQERQDLPFCNLAPEKPAFTELLHQKNCAVLRNAQGDYVQAAAGAFPPGLNEKNLQFFVFNTDESHHLFYRINADGTPDGHAVTLGLGDLVTNRDYPGLYFCLHSGKERPTGILIFGQANLTRYHQSRLPQGQKHCQKKK